MEEADELGGPYGEQRVLCVTSLSISITRGIVWLQVDSGLERAKYRATAMVNFLLCRQMEPTG